MYQASPSRACCTAPGSIRGRSPIRAELFPVGPSVSSRQVCSTTFTTPRRGAGCRGRAWHAAAGRPSRPRPAGAAGPHPQPVRPLGGQVEGAAGIPDPLHELDGGLAAPGDGRELVKDQGGVLALAGLAEGGVVGEVLQQQPHGRIRVLAAGQIRGAQVGEVDVLERPAAGPASKPPAVAAKKLANRPMAPLTARAWSRPTRDSASRRRSGSCSYSRTSSSGSIRAMSWPEERTGPSSPGAFRARRSRREADVLVVGLGPAEHGHEPVVEGGRVAPPAVHGQLRPEGDAGVGVAPQVAGQGALDEAGVGALAVDQEELAAVAGGEERLAFDVGGLAGAAGADDQPGAVLHESGDDDQAALVGPAEVAVDLDAEGDGAEVVVAHGRGPAHGRLHAAGGLALLLADLGRVDGLAAAGQVQGGGQQADRDGQGELGPQERPGRRVVQVGGAELAQPAE